MTITHDNYGRPMKIGIGITSTPQRSIVAHSCLKDWQKFLPDNATIFMHVDTGYKGVSKAKNEVLKLCYEWGADFIFIVDDDISPLVDKWWEPYINSGLNHACWNYDRKLLNYGCEADYGKCNYYAEYEKPNGCMLCFTRHCIETAGGWDLDFQGFGYEHVNLSDRIFNNGLTPARYIDIPNSKHLFELADCESTFSNEVRMATIPRNLKLYQQKYYSKEFKPFR